MLADKQRISCISSVWIQNATERTYQGLCMIGINCGKESKGSPYNQHDLMMMMMMMRLDLVSSLFLLILKIWIKSNYLFTSWTVFEIFRLKENIYIYIYIHGAFNRFPDFFVQAFNIVVDSWKFTVIAIHLMRRLANFYDFRFEWTATVRIGIHPTKAWLSPLVNFKNAIWTWGRTICNKLQF